MPLNRPVTKHIAEVLHSFFMEIVIAPDYEKEALAILEEKKNLRVIVMPNLASFSSEEDGKRSAGRYSATGL